MRRLGYSWCVYPNRAVSRLDQWNYSKFVMRSPRTQELDIQIICIIVVQIWIRCVFISFNNWFHLTLISSHLFQTLFYENWYHCNPYAKPNILYYQQSMGSFVPKTKSWQPFLELHVRLLYLMSHIMYFAWVRCHITYIPRRLKSKSFEIKTKTIFI